MGIRLGTLCTSLSNALDGGNETYSIRAAAVFCLLLAAMLWWIPILGPAVAGYVCGRKTGSLVKGLVCALSVGVFMAILIWALAEVILTAGGYPEVSAEEAAASLTGIAGAFGSYIEMFFSSGTSALDLSGFGLLTVFGGVGGILSGQVRRETAHLISVGATDGAVRSAARSVELYRKNKKIGFECFNDCIAMQDMMTNENPESKACADRRSADTKKERRPVSTTVQTVTTTVSKTSGTKEEGGDSSPFSDILQRSEHRKSGKE